MGRLTTLKRLSLPIAVLLIMLISLRSDALRLNNASVLVGTPVPSATTSHIFSFDLATASTLGSVLFEYCSNDPLIGAPCSAPAGLDVSAGSLTAQTGETGFAVNPVGTDANHVVLTRVPAPNAIQPVSYSFDNMVNPSTGEVGVYIRIYTFPTTDASGPYTDAGAAIYNTSGQLSTSGFVPPYITACVGISVALDCSSTNGSQAGFGNLSASSASAVTSQFSVATNDPTGYLTYIFGTPLTSGNNVIPALNAPGFSQPGSSQFGLNLRSNSLPSVGSEPQGVGSGQPQAGYGLINQYRFVNNTPVAGSNLPTEYNRFTVSYIANTSASQNPGAYAATMTFVSIAASF